MRPPRSQAQGPWWPVASGPAERWPHPCGAAWAQRLGLQRRRPGRRGGAGRRPLHTPGQGTGPAGRL